MKDFIEHISSYNLFNYLLPGVIFSVVLENSTSFKLLPENILLAAFICYFIGMIISRIGSTIIEPLLKNLKFLKFKDYKEFVEASKKDSKLDILSEQNNTYRSIVAMILMIVFAKLYEWGISQFPVLEKLNFYIIIVILLFLFLSAYKKQTSYISKRIEKNLKQ
jgi:hypothetical protein